MIVLAALAGVLGLGFLGLSATSAALFHTLGLAGVSTAVVTDKSFHDVAPAGRGSHCDYHRFEVAWADREGTFTVCDNPDFALIGLEVGDEVVIKSVPWSSEVTPEGMEGAYFWPVAGLLSGLGLTWLGGSWIRRYRRLVRGTASGVHLTGEVAACTRNTMTLRLETPGLDDRLLMMMPALKMPTAGEGDRVEAWTSRRSLLTRRPRGPWVVKLRRSTVAFTHAWLRGPE